MFPRTLIFLPLFCSVNINAFLFILYLLYLKFPSAAGTEAFWAPLTMQRMYVQCRIPHTHTRGVGEECLYTRLNCPDLMTSNRNTSRGRRSASVCVQFTLKLAVLCAILMFAWVWDTALALVPNDFNSLNNAEQWN